MGHRDTSAIAVAAMAFALSAGAWLLDGTAAHRSEHFAGGHDDTARFDRWLARLTLSPEQQVAQTIER